MPRNINRLLFSVYQGLGIFLSHPDIDRYGLLKARVQR
jgi:hypothetical protein